MNYYRATFSNGSVTKRSTVRVYTHAYPGGFSSSLILAQKAAQGREVVPVEEITAQEYRAQRTIYRSN